MRGRLFFFKAPLLDKEGWRKPGWWPEKQGSRIQGFKGGKENRFVWTSNPSIHS